MSGGLTPKVNERQKQKDKENEKKNVTGKDLIKNAHIMHAT